MENNEVWLVLRGKLFKSYESGFSEVESAYDEIVEIVKVDLISKSYAKLKENTVFTPNLSIGDIIKIKPCEGISESSAVMEFSGYLEDEEESNNFEKALSTLGGVFEADEQSFEEYLEKRDQHLRPIVKSSLKDNKLYEPEKIVSNGSYKINITFDAINNDQIREMKEHFNKWNVFFQHNLLKKLGSVSFGLDFKFKKAVDCLESAPYVNGCFISFNPNDFPMIDFDINLIPKSDG